MKDCADLIMNYIEDAKKRYSIDIIIYDRYNLLCADAELPIPEIRKWHQNPYCLAIKSESHLQKRCVYLKNKYQATLKDDGEVHSVTCFAGVTEISMPVFVKGKLFSIVAVTGIKGKLRDKTARLLSDKLSEDIKSLHKENLTELTVDETTSVAFFIKLLSALIKEHILSSPHYKNALDALSENALSPYIFSAIDYIKENFAEDIKTSDVASFCHLSSSYLQHLFIKVKGYGIAEEIRLCRLEHAKELLVSTDFSVRYIAISSGFRNVDYFSTAFKKHFGVTPLKLRQKKAVN